jgi:GPH family glycoside/pentoside/hexuronide:cation symporter
LLFGALPFALAFTLLWWRPPLERDLSLAIYYALAYVIFDASATFVYMPYFALTPELTADYDERTALTSTRMFFSIVGSLIAFTVPLAMVGTFTPDNAPRVLMMGLIFGIVSALPLLLVFFGTREREAYMAQAQPGIRESLRAVRGNRPFMFSLIMFLLTWVSIAVIQAALLYYIKYVIRREALNDLIMAVIFITALVVLPFWTWVSRRWGKRRAYIAGIAFWAIMQIALIMVGPSTGVPVIIGLCVLAGVGVGAAHVLPWAIIPDAIEWGEWQTGERHEGMFYSMVTLLHKVAASIAVPLALMLLDLSGYVPNVAQQPSSALLGIRVIIGPIPAILLCAGIIFAIRYPLDREAYARVCRELEVRRAEDESLTEVPAI